MTTWTEQLMDTVDCEKMLERLNYKHELVEEQWDRFCEVLSKDEAKA